MDAPDPTLLRQARPHLLSALATFGARGEDPYRVADRVGHEAAAAGLPPAACARLLACLRWFLGDLLLSRLDPFLLGTPAEDPRALFVQEALGGLFHPRPALALPAAAPEPPAVEDDEARDRALLEQLIAATRLYENGPAVKELLAFTIRFRAFAPFNAMILHIQKPGLTHAATAADWWQRFGRVPKAGTRPLLVLRAMGPVDFVFDVLDTEGRAIPEHAFTFPTLGTVSPERFEAILASLGKAGIELVPLDRGDGEAGWVRRHGTPATPKARQRYQLGLNRNHPLPTQLVTIAHELAHMFLGHLGEDKARDVRDRRDRGQAEREVEAEMTAYLVARRNGLTPRSESYLDAYKGAFTGLDLYGVMRAANMVEAAMGVAAHQLLPATGTELAA